MNATHAALIEARYPGDKHVFDRTEPLGEEWEQLGKPHVWNLKERDEGPDVTVYTDSGYGRMVAIARGKMIGEGRWFIQATGVVILDRDYYGVEKYIWR